MAASWYQSLFYIAGCFNTIIVVNLVIYLDATWYKFLFLPLDSTLLGSISFTAPSCLCLAKLNTQYLRIWYTQSSSSVYEIVIVLVSILIILHMWHLCVSSMDNETTCVYLQIHTACKKVDKICAYLQISMACKKHVWFLYTQACFTSEPKIF